MQPVMGSVDGAASQPGAISVRAAQQADATNDGAAAPQPDVTSDEVHPDATSDGAALHPDATSDGAATPRCNQ